MSLDIMRFKIFTFAIQMCQMKMKINRIGMHFNYIYTFYTWKSYN